MIRIIVRSDDAGMALHVGGGVCTEFKTFEVAAPDLEAYVNKHTSHYGHTTIIGIEIIDHHPA